MRLPICVRRYIDKTSSPHGCWLWTGGTQNGYGNATYEGQSWRAHRLIWTLLRGPIPKRRKGKKVQVLHNCPGGDNRRCCRPSHLWLGTQKQNMQDCSIKGRIAMGSRHGLRLHPECRATGDRNGTYTHPERLARGDRNGSRLHPERLRRGEAHGKSKVTEQDVRDIRKRYATKVTTFTAIALDYNVSSIHIGRIIRRQIWKHVL